MSMVVLLISTSIRLQSTHISNPDLHIDMLYNYNIIVCLWHKYRDNYPPCRVITY